MAKQDLLLEIRRYKNLKKAWHVVYENAKASPSIETKDNVENFYKDYEKKLKKIQTKIKNNTFVFEPAKGVLQKKKDGKSFRPMVIAPVESRIVQRAILNVLSTINSIKKYIESPHSFGGVRKKEGSDLSAVPAAIKEVLKAYENGCQYVVCADISAFFTRIDKKSVEKIISESVEDPEFIVFFKQAISVKLKNEKQIDKKHLNLFPLGDLGVAQGNPLSPFLGNIILYQFDKKMNSDNCRCIRYIDDFVILGPTKEIVEEKFHQAKEFLKSLGMSVSEEKSSKNAFQFNENFEFLGIEFSNGFIKPSKQSRERFISGIDELFNKSKAEINAWTKKQNPKNKKLDKTKNFINTLKTIDGKIQAWGKQYYYCNDGKIFKEIDMKISTSLSIYMEFYKKITTNANNTYAYEILGIESLTNLKREPFSWPKKINTNKI